MSNNGYMIEHTIKNQMVQENGTHVANAAVHWWNIVFGLINLQFLMPVVIKEGSCCWLNSVLSTLEIHRYISTYCIVAWTTINRNLYSTKRYLSNNGERIFIGWGEAMAKNVGLSEKYRRTFRSHSC